MKYLLRILAGVLISLIFVLVLILKILWDANPKLYIGSDKGNRPVRFKDVINVRSWFNGEYILLR